MDNFEESLINEIENNPALYNKGLKEYRNRILKDRIWKKISEILGVSAEECQIRWKSLRDAFGRDLLKIKKETKSGSGEDDMPRWKYFHSMLFLKEHMNPHRRAISNIGAASSTAEEVHTISVGVGRISPGENSMYVEETPILETESIIEFSSEEILPTPTPTSTPTPPQKRKRNNQDSVDEGFSKFLQKVENFMEKRFSSTTNVEEDKWTGL